VRLTATPVALGDPAAIVPEADVPTEAAGAAVAAGAEAALVVGALAAAVVGTVVGAGAVVAAGAEAAALVGTGVSVALLLPPHAASRSGSAKSATTLSRNDRPPHQSRFRICPLLSLRSAFLIG
jgi:hypothetical protein